ncbi:hypothetical protein NVP1264O_05 [Vibrio phage 1.264.O._10N.286.51.F2]|nr:hypothetical protein NVP1264O_05 [Vibrio phage 1.264.O._10N.286.51.F2]
MGNMLKLVKLFVELGHTVTVESENKLTITRLNGNSVKVVRLKIVSGEGQTFDLYTQRKGQANADYIGWSRGYRQAVEAIIFAVAEMR